MNMQNTSCNTRMQVMRDNAFRHCWPIESKVCVLCGVEAILTWLTDEGIQNGQGSRADAIMTYPPHKAYCVATCTP